MSLVAYAASSDEESDTESVGEQLQLSSSKEYTKFNDRISDDDEYDAPLLSKDNTRESLAEKKRLFNIPAPRKRTDEDSDLSTKECYVAPAFHKLPKPKPTDEADRMEEVDDEFLHKKEKPSEEEKPPPPPVPKKGPVKITVPSLSQFKDLEIAKPSVKSVLNANNKSTNLLSLLPKPKNETVLDKGASMPSTTQQITRSVTSLVPDSVKNHANKKNVQNATKSTHLKRALAKPASDSEDSDPDSADFFSFNYKQNLPEVSETEINAMVAKKAAQMASAAVRMKEIPQHTQEEPSAARIPQGYQPTYPSTPSEEVGFDDRAIKALVGGRAKRQKMEDVNLVELSANEVLPNKDEWLRTALASSTAYQPRGVLVDEEPAPGTRRKHQITYLAHQAKANELELQAMWSANRNTRRQTQGKYGF